VQQRCAERRIYYHSYIIIYYYYAGFNAPCVGQLNDNIAGAGKSQITNILTVKLSKLTIN